MNVEPEGYLTTAEAALFLRIAPKTLRNKVAAGFFIEGTHFFRRAGLGPRWKRSALIAWMEHETEPPACLIPMARSGRAHTFARAARERV